MISRTLGYQILSTIQVVASKSYRNCCHGENGRISMRSEDKYQITNIATISMVKKGESVCGQISNIATIVKKR